MDKKNDKMVKSATYGTGRDQHRTIILDRFINVVVNRVFVQKVVPIVRVGVAIFGHPTGTCQQGMEAFHIQKRDGAMNGAKEIRTHRVHVAHQETACKENENKTSETLVSSKSKSILSSQTLLIFYRIYPSRT
jgi:hypothetical protein